MDAFRLLVLVVGLAALMILFLVGLPYPQIPSVSGAMFLRRDATTTAASREGKSKESLHTYNPRTSSKIKESKMINLEDYRPIDPAPATETSVRGGPIQHNAPLNPYIPQRRPPPPPPPPLRGLSEDNGR